MPELFHLRHEFFLDRIFIFLSEYVEFAILKSLEYCGHSGEIISLVGVLELDEGLLSQLLHRVQEFVRMAEVAGLPESGLQFSEVFIVERTYLLLLRFSVHRFEFTIIALRIFEEHPFPLVLGISFELRLCLVFPDRQYPEEQIPQFDIVPQLEFMHDLLHLDLFSLQFPHLILEYEDFQLERLDFGIHEFYQREVLCDECIDRRDHLAILLRFEEGDDSRYPLEPGVLRELSGLHPDELVLSE